MLIDLVSPNEFDLEKTLNLRLKTKGLEFDTRSYLDDLEVALALLANLYALYDRLDQKQKNILLRIPIKRIIINKEGEIISHELHPPFSYLSTLVTQNIREN